MEEPQHDPRQRGNTRQGGRRQQRRRGKGRNAPRGRFRQHHSRPELSAVPLRPRPADVLLGRGPKVSEHPGNRSYRAKVERRRTEYRTRDKTRVKKEIVQAVHRASGRFLKYNEVKKMWFEVSDDVAEEKVAQSMRNIKRGDRTTIAAAGPDSVAAAAAPEEFPLDDKKENRDQNDSAVATPAVAAAAEVQYAVSQAVFVSPTTTNSSNNYISHMDPRAVRPEPKHSDDEVLFDQALECLMVGTPQEQGEVVPLLDSRPMVDPVRRQRSEPTGSEDVVSDEEVHIYLKTGICQREETTGVGFFEPIQRLTFKEKDYIAWFLVALSERAEDEGFGALAIRPGAVLPSSD